MPHLRRSGYLFLCRLAEGGMGHVDLVVRREGRFERLYARKRLLPDLRRDPAFRAMFMDEARLAGFIRHPNVVSVTDVGHDRDGPYLVMDYVEGVPASRLVAEAATSGRRIPVQIAVRVALDVARGLHAAHETRGPDGTPLGLVHRDVSPQNILVGFDGTVRVSDFGIAKAFGNASRTSTGILKGNVGYVSPEQLRFEEPDRRSDLFALGVVLYELLACERLYGDADPLAGPRRILSEPPPDVGQVRADVPPALVELTVELLAKDPGARPATAHDVAARLEDVLAALVHQEGALSVAEHMRARFHGEADRRQGEREAARRGLLAARGRRAGLAVGAAAVALALAGGGAWRATRARPDGAEGARTTWAGHWHTCASDRGAVHCWGKNNEGQLGDGTTTDRLTRVRVPALDGAAGVALGAFHGCFCAPAGQVWCWGRNLEGQLGADGPSRTAPAPVAGIGDCVAVTAGSFHSCVLHRDRTVSCWGSWWERRISPGAGSAKPSKVAGVADVRALDSDGDYRSSHACAVRGDGRVVCWGAGGLDRPGDPQPGTTDTSARVVDGVTDAREVACGTHFACARRGRGDVVCWGQHRWTDDADRRPATVPGVTAVVQLAAGSTHACALGRDGGITCWGDGREGQLGDGRVRPQPNAPARARTGVVASEIAVGGAHTCARHAAGIVCWGLNESGQLGDGTADRKPLPVSVAGFGR